MILSRQDQLAAVLPGLIAPSLDWEIRSERASSMGRAGRAIEESLAALKRFEGPPEERDRLVRQAADAVWSYFVQREMMGFSRHDDAIETYGIPREVLRRVGC